MKEGVQMSCYNRYRKKKKRGKKRKRKQVRQVSRKKRQMPKHSSRRCNRHHLCWQKRHWKGRWAKQVREFWYCKVDIPAETIHRYVHEVMLEIPVPKEPNAERVLYALHSLDRRGMLRPNDAPTRRLTLLIRLFGECPTSIGLRQERSIFEEWERQLGNPTEG